MANIGELKKAAQTRSEGTLSNENAEIKEKNRIEELSIGGSEAKLVIKGNVDIRVLYTLIYLNIYCKDGSLHYASGKYRVYEKLDSIEGDFTTTLTLRKESGEVTGQSYVFDNDLVYSGVASSYSGSGKKIPIITGNTSGDLVIQDAFKYIGNPYVWGGSSLTNGCDCSHFVWLVLKECGYDYGYRTSYYWRSVGEEVSRSQAKPGDVLCYQGHVAFYVNDHCIVHARGKKYGIESTECDPFNYHGGVITIRRVIKVDRFDY